MRLRLASWNVDSRPTGSLDAKVDLLHRLAPDVALLQELRRPVYRSFIPHAQAHERLHGRPRLFSWGVLSTDLSELPASDRHVGCAVLGAAATALLGAAGVDPALALANRAIAARVAVGDGASLTVCSLHVPRPLSSDGDPVTPAFRAAMVSWLGAQPLPLVLGVDSGAAEVDEVATAAGLVVAGGGEDADRTGRVWTSPDVGSARVEYHRDAAAAAGSDHAAIVVDLVLPGSVAPEK